MISKNAAISIDDFIVILKRSRTPGDRLERFWPNLVCTRVGNAKALEKKL